MAEETSARPDSGAYDDRPVRFDMTQYPPEVVAPLAPFEGREPDAPKWFKDAVADAPERRFVESSGSRIELLTWGEIGKPGLLLVHGNTAHADWWSFIAPLLAQHYRVAALSLAGMGGSDWRDVYAFSDFARDAETCARAAKLYEDGQAPIYIGHSFGGLQVLFTAAHQPRQMRAAILIDSALRSAPPVDEPNSEGSRAFAAAAERSNRVYATVAEALARFRLLPPQPTENLYIADFIARRSLRPAPMADGSGQGWTWCFDPKMWIKLDRTQANGLHEGRWPKVEIPMIHLIGSKSGLAARRMAGEPSPLPKDSPEIEIPDAFHHVMLDQPLALVAALRGILATWPA